MSLQELKEWSFQNNHPRSSSLSEKHMPVLDKRFSANEDIPKNRLTSDSDSSRPLVLGEITNRVSMGVEKNRSLSNVMKIPQEPKSISSGVVNK